ncbi:MAG: hypothetical protein ACK5WO_01575 [Cyclobacteriaceae bacterium]|jgi:hypothetical protein
MRNLTKKTVFGDFAAIARIYSAIEHDKGAERRKAMTVSSTYVGLVLKGKRPCRPNTCAHTIMLIAQEYYRKGTPVNVTQLTKLIESIEDDKARAEFAISIMKPLMIAA